MQVNDQMKTPTALPMSSGDDLSRNNRVRTMTVATKDLEKVLS